MPHANSNKTKTCCRCLSVKPISAFHRNKNYPDGLMYDCKVCRNTRYLAYITTNAAREKAAIRQQRYNLKTGYASQKKYRHSLKGNAAFKLWNKQNSERNKNAIRQTVIRATAKGVIVRPSRCSQCGAPGLVHAHHMNYARPFDIAWLCPACHSATHWRERPNRRLPESTTITIETIEKSEGVSPS